MSEADRLARLSKLLKVVDIVFEVADARCPFTSRGSQVKKLIANKRALLILNKADLADPETTENWVKFFACQGENALPVDALRGKGLDAVRESLEREGRALAGLLKGKGRRRRPLRAAVMGIPNTGKSSILNRLLGKRAAARGNRPGITRGPQWVHLHGAISVLDTPGLLQPHLKEDDALFKLALIRAADPESYDQIDLSERLLSYLSVNYPQALLKHLRMAEAVPALESVAREKNFLSANGEYDLQRAAVFILSSYGKGKLGRISLEAPADFI